MDKKEMIFPEVEVIKFTNEDIITVSGCDDFDGWDCGNTDGYYCCQGDVHK